MPSMLVPRSLVWPLMLVKSDELTDDVRPDVRLKNFGLDLIEVSDNGCGVEPQNFQALSKHPISVSSGVRLLTTPVLSTEALDIKAHRFRRPLQADHTWLPRVCQVAPAGPSTTDALVFTLTPREALSSLCAVSSVSISTRSASQQTATRLVFDLTGSITSQLPIAREVISR